MITWDFNTHPSSEKTLSLQSLLIGDRMKNVVQAFLTQLAPRQLVLTLTQKRTVAKKVFAITRLNVTVMAAYCLKNLMY